MTEVNFRWPAPSGPQGEAYFVPDEPAPSLDDRRGFASRTLTADVKSLGSGEFLLFEGPFERIASDSGVTASITEVPELGIGRQRSAQGVYFGQLMLQSEQQPALPELVAVKPYNKARDAVHEAGAMLLVNELNPRRRTPLSLEPLGFYRMPDTGQVGLVTRYEHGVTTQDNLFWNPDRVPTEREVERALSEAAFALGGLHHYGIAHKDAQAKNIAADTRGMRIVDLTGAEPIAADAERAREQVVGDVDTYIGSLLRVEDGASGEPVMGDRSFTDAVIKTFGPLYAGLTNAKFSKVPTAARLSTADIATLARA